MKRTFAGLVSFLATFAAQTGHGSALEVSQSLNVDAPAAGVWAIIGDFCAIEKWHPRVERCVLLKERSEEGKAVLTRGLVASGGLGTIVEVQTRRDDKAMSYSYAYIAGPLPVKAYNATISVHPNGLNSTVVWTATFDAAGMSDAEAMADIEGVYKQGLAQIAKEARR